MTDSELRDAVWRLWDAAHSAGDKDSRRKAMQVTLVHILRAAGLESFGWRCLTCKAEGSGKGAEHATATGHRVVDVRRAAGQGVGPTLDPKYAKGWDDAMEWVRANAPNVAVEVTREDLLAAAGDVFLPDYVLHSLNARLRARAGQPQAPAMDVEALRVVERPTEDVSELVVPEAAGVDGDTRIVLQRMSGVEQYATANHFAHFGHFNDIVRWCVPGQPWVERTTTPRARAWEAGDVPAGSVVAVCDSAINRNRVFSWCFDEDRHLVADWLNKWGGVLLVIPDVTTLGAAR